MSATSEGLARLKAGSRLYGQAARLIDTEGATPEAERILRSSFGVLRSAMNWLEDTSHFEVAHRRLDGAGALARRTFPEGCHLAMEGSTYFQECAVALAHDRMGMSPGYIV